MLYYYSQGQNSVFFNPSVNHFLLNKGSNNPSSYGNQKVFGSFNYKNQLGLLSEIRNIYLDLGAVVKGKQTIGTKIYSEQETDLFTRNKLNFLYAYKIKLGDNFFWSLGTQFGGANISFSSSNASPGGNAWSLDLSISSTMEIRDLEWGLALHQIPNTELVPIGFKFELKRYIHSYLSYRFLENSKIEFESGAEVKVNEDFLLWSLDNIFLYGKSHGLTFQVGSKFSFSAGVLLQLPEKLSPITLNASYSNFLGNPNIKTNSISFGFVYSN